MKPTLRAIISDQKLHGSKMATVYGSSSDNDTIRIFKQVGYGISIFFLLLTLAIYFVIKEVRTVSFHLKNEVKVQNCKKMFLLFAYKIFSADCSCWMYDNSTFCKHSEKTFFYYLEPLTSKIHWHIILKC